MDSVKRDRLSELHERIERETDFEKRLTLVKEFERVLDEETGEEPVSAARRITGQGFRAVRDQGFCVLLVLRLVSKSWEKGCRKPRFSEVLFHASAFPLILEFLRKDSPSPFHVFHRHSPSSCSGKSHSPQLAPLSFQLPRSA